MNSFKSIIINQFRTLSIVVVVMSMSLFLLMLRMKLTHSFFYLFLVWNLFLALIPYAITVYLQYKTPTNKLVFVSWFCIWLAFLPNAAYIITDLWHLRLNYSNFFWLDILVVSSFAASGLLLFYLSLQHMKHLFRGVLSDHKRNLLIITIVQLSAFGIYLGRFLRYNSWEILSGPQHLFTDILSIIIQPYQHKEAWLFTLVFGLFLNVGFWVFNALTPSHPHNLEDN